jgi:type IV pilus assembly protein PilA
MKGITTIHTAEVQYYSSYGRFATSLRELGPSGVNLIERDLAGGKKDGNRFTLTATPAGYAISAGPDQSCTSADKNYFSDQGMGIHVHNAPEPATLNDPLQGEISAPRQSN